MGRAGAVACVAGVMILAGVWGCSGMRDLAAGLNPMSPAERAYWEVASRYLVRARVYQGPATRLILKALPLNWQVRSAQLRREAAAYGWDENQLRKRLGQARADQRGWDELAIVLFTPDAKANDLDQARSSWRVYLAGGGKRLEPVDIRALRKRTPRALMLYPFWDPWSRLYIVRFKALGSSRARLVVTGPAGRAEVEVVLRTGQ